MWVWISINEAEPSLADAYKKKSVLTNIIAFSGWAKIRYLIYASIHSIFFLFFACFFFFEVHFFRLCFLLCKSCFLYQIVFVFTGWWFTWFNQLWRYWKFHDTSHSMKFIFDWKSYVITALILTYSIITLILFCNQ